MLCKIIFNVIIPLWIYFAFSCVFLWGFYVFWTCVFLHLFVILCSCFVLFFPSVCSVLFWFVCFVLLCFILLLLFRSCLSPKRRQKVYVDPDRRGGRAELGRLGERGNCYHNKLYEKYLFSIEEKRNMKLLNFDWKIGFYIKKN